MNRTLPAAACAAALTCSAATGAASLDDELAAIKARLSALERQVREQDAEIRAKDREIAALRDASRASDDGHWSDRVEVGGVIEVEASHTSPYRGDSESDIVVATVEVGIAAQINDWTAGEIVLLYE
ncbi:MAG: hypothetical protein QNJ91_09435 [Gammaproteobacteria bacterium]|nr:hypothetical protein [Gammaproteobacteria bacterium]